MSESDTIHLKEFDIKSVTFRICSAPRVLIIGRRSTGKTTLVGRILEHHQDILSRGTVIAGLKEEKTFYSKYVEKSCIYNEYDASIIENALERKKEIIRQIEENDGTEKNNSVIPRSCVVMDNCFFDITWYREKNVQLLLLNGCVFKIMTIITMDYPFGIPPVLRCNIDYVFILKESYIKHRKRIWEHYCGNLISFEKFSTLMDKYTTNYDCLVINYTNRTWKIEEIFSWLKAS